MKLFAHMIYLAIITVLGGALIGEISSNHASHSTPTQVTLPTKSTTAPPGICSSVDSMEQFASQHPDLMIYCPNMTGN